ncbi:VOC family protein [Roseomonas sp. F4]
MAVLSPRGLFETHLNVRDLDRSVAFFFRHVVGLEPAHVVEHRAAAFLWIGGRGHAMLGLWAGSSSPNAMKLHIAFALPLEEVLAAPARLRAAGVEPLDFFAQPTQESTVLTWMPAASVYFRDPDGHSIEVLAMLDEAPRPELGNIPWSEWRRQDGLPAP